jgi:hypothetical protein
MSFRTNPDGRWVIDHSPSAKLDYSFNWGEKPDGSAPWLDAANSETIANSVWTASPGITLSQPQVLNGKVTIVFAAGGEDGKVYALTNTITTTAGRIDSRTINLVCRPRDR